MELGIVGLAHSGKTTIFNALTGGHAETGTYGAVEPNIGVVRVPDSRIDRLAEIFKPKRKVYAEIKYLDFPGSGASFSKGEGPGGAFLAALGQTDALIHVVRAFEDAAVPHPNDSIDPDRDISSMALEFSFADLALIERRLQRLAAQLRSAKAAERDAAHREIALLQRIKGELEAEVPVRDQSLAPDEAKLLESYVFLTARPVLLIINIGEDDLPRAAELEVQYAAKYRSGKQEVAVVCGKIEQDLAQMPPADADELRGELGLQEAGLNRAIRLSYHLLGLISFLTVGPDECRAWTVTEGATAPKAAGRIHTDLERGFIRAEAIGWQELLDCGGYPEAKKRGLVRLEGKNYVVKDGDVLNILFNV